MDDQILTAFRDSVDETMDEIERESKTRVRRHNVDANRTIEYLVWAQFIDKFGGQFVELMLNPLQ